MHKVTKQSNGVGRWNLAWCLPQGDSGSISNRQSQHGQKVLIKPGAEEAARLVLPNYGKGVMLTEVTEETIVNCTPYKS